MLHKVCITLLFAITVCGASAQQVEARIAGLEGNEEYMSLLREDAVLQFREDSVIREVNEVRRLFREHPETRRELSQEILTLEEQIFRIRNAKGRLTDRIGGIEQEWVLSNLNTARTSVRSQTAVPEYADSEKVRNLVYNAYFGEQLPQTDYAALKRAQQMEITAVDYVNRYFTNYNEIVRLAGLYAVESSETIAADLYGRYTTLQGLNRALADSLAGTWSYIFDNKSYAYGYLLETLGREDLLMREEQLFAEAAQQLSRIRGKYASDEVADYFLRKRVAVDYERQMAELLRLDAARDSLRGVTAQLREIDYQLPRIEVERRYFIDYAPVVFSAASKYTYANPIPECRIYPRGTVYRILLGTFATKRAASLFKGAYPLCYRINDNGKWCYYAGGFATRAEADEAQKLLKNKGFLRPEIVVWRDGAYRNLTLDPEQLVVIYRVEIEGSTTLPDAVRDLIATQIDSRELLRVDERLFAVGPFADRIEADRLASALRATDAVLEIKVAEYVEVKK